MDDVVPDPGGEEPPKSKDQSFEAMVMEKVALDLQRRWRGRKARKWFELLRLAKVQRWWRSRRARKLILGLRKAWNDNRAAAKKFRPGEIVDAVFPGDVKQCKAYMANHGSLLSQTYA